uniref:Uncharacterized protein n=1 Tax=Romanomermis culicivorax TaxID=13658 RepID=A0A915JLX4_ROMCU
MMNWNDCKKWIQEHANLGTQLSNEQAEDIVCLLAKYPKRCVQVRIGSGEVDQFRASYCSLDLVGLRVQLLEGFSHLQRYERLEHADLYKNYTEDYGYLK